VFCLIALFVMHRVVHSFYGNAARAIREDEECALSGLLRPAATHSPGVDARYAQRTLVAVLDWPQAAEGNVSKRRGEPDVGFAALS